jgi:hypothetical protein
METEFVECPSVWHSESFSLELLHLLMQATNTLLFRIYKLHWHAKSTNLPLLTQTDNYPWRGIFVYDEDFPIRLTELSPPHSWPWCKPHNVAVCPLTWAPSQADDWAGPRCHPNFEAQTRNQTTSQFWNQMTPTRIDTCLASAKLPPWPNWCRLRLISMSSRFYRAPCGSPVPLHVFSLGPSAQCLHLAFTTA